MKLFLLFLAVAHWCTSNALPQQQVTNQLFQPAPIQGFVNPILLAMQGGMYGALDFAKTFMQLPQDLINNAQTTMNNIMGSFTSPKFEPVPSQGRPTQGFPGLDFLGQLFNFQRPPQSVENNIGSSSNLPARPPNSNAQNNTAAVSSTSLQQQEQAKPVSRK